MTAVKQIRLLCDTCPAEFDADSDVLGSVREVRRLANRNGWRVYANGSKDACDRCAKRRRQQVSQTIEVS